VPVEEVTQEVREQQLVNRFDFYTMQNGPQKGAVILHFLGFGVVSIIGIDPDQARIRDIAIKVVHSGFYTRTEVWVKVVNGTRGLASTSHLQT
jgi:hypothetical protein